MAAPAITSNVHSREHGVIVTVTQSEANDGVVGFEVLAPLVAMSFQVLGTVGAGTVELHGSNDGSTFVALPTAVSVSAAGVKSVATADLGYKYYGVFVDSSDGTNDVTAYVRGTYAT